MITDLAALKIKAAAYDRIQLLVNSLDWTVFSELGDQVIHLVRDANGLLAAASFDAQGVNEQLRQTRMQRLLSTQFVFCPRDHHPRIEHKKGTDLLREHTETRVIKNEADAYEQLAQTETELFDTDDEAIVFWRGDHLWSFASVPDQDRLVASCTYYMCHRYDGEIHAETRPLKPVFHVDVRAMPRSFLK